MSKGVLFINGFSNGQPRRYEARMFRRLEAKGITTVHARVDWQVDQPAEQLQKDLTKQARMMARSVAELCIVGVSAGGHMAISVFDELTKAGHGENVSTISVAGRLRGGEVASWSWRTLERAAHMGTERASQTFYDSLVRFEDAVIPSLTPEEKLRTTIVQPLLDEVVPLHTMKLEDAHLVTVPAVGHAMACALGTSVVAKCITP